MARNLWVLSILLRSMIAAAYLSNPPAKNLMNSVEQFRQPAKLKMSMPLSFQRREILLFGSSLLSGIGVVLFPFNAVSARSTDADGLFEKVAAQSALLDAIEKLIDEEKWTDARKLAKGVDASLRSGVLMPLSRTVGRKVKGIVEMSSILFEDFVELDKCNRAQNKQCAKEQVTRVRSTINQLLGLEENVLEVL